MNLRLSRAVTVRLAQGEPVIPDVTAATLPERFRGKPKIDSSRCPEGCSKCVHACPTHAISLNPLSIDLGACVFCPLCIESCPEGAITYTNDYKMAATSREGLLLREGGDISAEGCTQEIHRLFGRSLKLRSVSAGGCNGCELELSPLGNLNFELGPFRIQFLASPPHPHAVFPPPPPPHPTTNPLQATCH